MDNRFKNRIKTTLRRLTWAWRPYNNVKNAAKVDKATYCCIKCSKYCYTGKSKKSLTDLQKKYTMKNIEQGPIFIDHIDPVEDPINGWQGWDVFIERLFCSEKNLQPLCKKCHDIKSAEEKKLRRKKK